jgi:protein-tyrosine-phosphatase
VKRVLFVCVGNSCRSQMAEGFAKTLGKGVLHAYSAGSRPSGHVAPTAVAVMKEKGVDLSKHYSKGLKDVPQEGWDYVVTMGCGDVCPFVPAKATLDWKIPDPYGKTRKDFVAARDLVEKNVRALLDEIRSGA